jgi:uncharacterized protein with HEPN domain
MKQRPWTLMAGMRDKLIHSYDIVDLPEQTTWDSTGRLLR